MNKTRETEQQEVILNHDDFLAMAHSNAFI